MASRQTRRKFIKAGSMGAAGVALGGLVYSPTRAFGYVPRDEINPNISNLRVVYVHADAMTNGTGPVSGWSSQNAATNDAVVAANMDKMACALAQRIGVTEAWQTIFIRPPAKQWREAVVAIKTNTIHVQHTRNAVMKKMCEVLVNNVGVTPSNIHIFDAVDGGNMPWKTPWYGLPAGVRVENAWGGQPSNVSVPPPYNGGTRCVASIASGTVDILINICLCKGHSWEFGNFTMSMKNHYGTLSPKEHGGTTATNYLIGINKSETILGQMGFGTGRIIYPRQQLVFMDALWASQGGPSGEPSVRPNRFYMGTFGPVFDYLLATRFRRDAMGWSINTAVADRFLSEFGYSAADFPAGEAMVDALAWEPLENATDPRWRSYE